ncbi:hypothetical protein BDN72DRAFT_956649 [Pluteus cervinus]|uniref:Uncharacterized protein n=1 Tax=Pluteus cervinus TaxID=181527 RepID=A0ACD3B600_9AGAR|nr:hypothetical protein BDN72DRAFT_956649 [Pluteus cervinus]
MKRRSNKSHKVPNVKLRPAQPDALKTHASRFSDAECWAEDSQLGSDDTVLPDVCPRPFKKVVLCATGISDKPTLFKQALELGAQSTSAFTDRVTHLIAADPGGAKYRCAVERKIPIMHSSWITESYATWLRGDDVDFDESVATYRLPIFSDVVLCLSDNDDIEHRKEVTRLVTEHKGTLLKNLERPVRVTHLLCSGDEETDKLRYAAKFNERGEANIHIVWEEWFWDSLEFGGRFDESLYHIRNPRPERRNPEPATSPPPSSLGPSDTSPSKNPTPHQHTADSDQDDDDDEVVASIKKIPAVTLHLWSSLLKVRGYEVQDGKLLQSPTKPKPARLPPVEPIKAGGSIISAFRRANSFAIPEATNGSTRQPFRRVTTTTGVNLRNSPLPEVAESHAGPSGSAVAGPSNLNKDAMAAESAILFVGLRFRALGEARSASVREAIKQKGGQLVSDAEADEDVDYVIVRLVSGTKIYRDETEETLRPKYRTECWLEKCIYEDRICDPEEHITFRPLSVPLPVSDTEFINMSFSGFEDSEACWLTRLLRALGINHAKAFSRRSTHLLCPSGVGLKFTTAKEWGIPVVNTDWLAAIATSGSVPPIGPYVVGGAHGRPSNQSPKPNVDAKGKGRAADLWNSKQSETKSTTYAEQDFAMQDITNPVNELQHDDNLPQLIPPLKSQPASETLPTRPATPLKFGVPSDILIRPSLTNHPANTPPRHLRTPTRSSKRLNIAGLPTRPNSTTSTPTKTPGSRTGRVRSRSQFLNSQLLPPSEHQQQLSQPLPQGAVPSSQDDEKRIPSSRTPSPMKTPQAVLRRRTSMSPTKLVVDPDAAKALKESITSLLGKRPSEEDAPGAQTMGGRPGKRVRPQRSKAQLKETSNNQVLSISTIPAPDFGETIQMFESIEDVNTSLSGEGDEEGLGVGARHPGDDSMRVSYEDPAQMDERKRLMNLLKSQAEIDVDAEEPEKKKVKTKGGGGKSRSGSARTASSASASGGSAPGASLRRSTRVAGS